MKKSKSSGIAEPYALCAIKNEGKSRGGRRDDTCDHGLLSRSWKVKVDEKKKKKLWGTHAGIRPGSSFGYTRVGRTFVCDCGTQHGRQEHVRLIARSSSRHGPGGSCVAVTRVYALRVPSDARTTELDQEVESHEGRTF